MGRRLFTFRLLSARWWTFAAIAALLFAVGYVMVGSHILARPKQSDTTAFVETPALESLPARPADTRAQLGPKLSVADALSRNAAVPFAVEQVGPPPRFRFGGSAIDRERAIECLALAAMAEAGSSDAGQRAVMQVILNRVRHPAFAKTICDVVFEGSERETGCQFTFTCDGSLSHHYRQADWGKARRRAGEALDGFVFAQVGTATHYHTDWVYPYWSSSLDKVAKVDTHLFFRWKGYWGAPGNFVSRYRGQERTLAELMKRANGGSGVTLMAEATDQVAVPIARNATSLGASSSGVVRRSDGGGYLVGYASVPTAAQALAGARRLCGGNGYCRVMGWIDRSAMPKSFPVPLASRARLSFSYVLDGQNHEIVFYDCRQFSGIERAACLPRFVRPT